MTSAPARTSPTSARNAVALVFALNGLCFATLASRVPDLRESLDLSNGALGPLLLSVAVGAMVGMPVSGHLIERFGAGAVVRLGAACDLVGLVVAGLARHRRLGSGSGASGCSPTASAPGSGTSR